MQQAVLVVLPADQCFVTDRDVVGQVHDRLEVRLQPVSGAERGAERLFEFQVMQGSRLVLHRIVDLGTRPAAALCPE